MGIGIVDVIWSPAHIIDQAKPEDFVAIAAGIVIGRIYRVRGGPRDGEGYFNFQLGRKPFRTSAMNGIVPKRKTAKLRVLKAFESYLGTPLISEAASREKSEGSAKDCGEEPVGCF